MKLSTTIEPGDIVAVKRLVERMKDHPFVQERMVTNTSMPPKMISRSDMWRELVMCLLTTQNKSGKGSPVETFGRTEPFPLCYDVLQQSSRPGALIEDTLSHLKIRRWKICSQQALENLEFLAQGGWKILGDLGNQLYAQRANPPCPDQIPLERQAAEVAIEHLKGIGPKQSRNFWQALGLTRYEIPIDSRSMKWFEKTLGFYMPSSGLSDERFYCLVADAIQSLCDGAQLLPCILDAAIFASFENQTSSELGTQIVK